MLYNLSNILKCSLKHNPVIVSRVLRAKNRFKTYRLYKHFSVRLSNNKIIHFEKGFEFDQSSTPRLLWWLLPPDGDFIIGALIHDWIYQNKDFVTKQWFNGNKRKARKFADKEMLKWSKAVNGTIKISLQNIDNHTRYFGVRAFGWMFWNKKRK